MQVVNSVETYFIIITLTKKIYQNIRVNSQFNWSVCPFFVMSLTSLQIKTRALSSLPQCNLVLGLNLSSYRTFTSAVVTMVRLQLGVFNYDEVKLLQYH